MAFLDAFFIVHGHQVCSSAQVFAPERGEQQAKGCNDIDWHADFLGGSALVFTGFSVCPCHQHHRGYHGVKAPEGNVRQEGRQQVTLDQAVEYFNEDPAASGVYAHRRKYPPVPDLLDEVSHEHLLPFSGNTHSSTAVAMQ
ncbi:hypothetical protein ES703_53595 [subsurface metagenome]